MTRAAYNGHEALTFPDYLDLETGKTLYAEPGQVYDIAPASGHVVPGFPVPWFGFPDDETQAAHEAAEAGDGESQPEPGTAPEPPEDGQSF